MSGQQYTDQKIATTSDHSPLPMPLNHEDSDLTVNQIDDKTEVDVEKASAAFDPSEEPVLVDGPLYGWVIVFASFMSQMISMGICNVYGVYQGLCIVGFVIRVLLSRATISLAFAVRGSKGWMSYYLSNTFNGSANSFQLAWIGSLAIVALDMAGPFTGSICDHFGHRRSALLGVVIMTLALVAAAFSTKVWMLYLTQGLLYGGGSSLVYFASLSLPSQWFKANRGLVTGISISGGGIGGLWLSPLVSKFLETKGLRWTMLCIAIAQFIILIPVCMLFRTRVESGVERAKRIKKFGYRKGESLEQDKQRKMIDFTILKNKRFILLFVAGIAVVSAYFSPFYFINSYAVQHGVDSSTAALMVGLMNGASAVGRIVMGFASDKMGPINALFISTFFASLCILFIWTFAKTVAVMMLFSILYGLCCGAYLSSTVSVTGAICGQERLATVTGIIYAGMAIGSLIGSPTSGAILDSVGHTTDYMGVILWSGIMMAIGTTILFALRVVTSRSVFVRV